MKNSRIVRLRTVFSVCRSISDMLYEDRVRVYAAQASFFVMISAVPFLSLLFAVIGAVMPADLTKLTESFRDLIPLTLLDTFTELLTELRDVPGLSLLSISALTTLWSASKGISAIRDGIQTVYRVERHRSFLRNKVHSLLYTIGFIIMILAVVVILLFGDFLYGVVTEKLGFAHGLLDRLFRVKTPIFIVFITLIFNTMYYVIARRNRDGNPCIPRRFCGHLPGAVFAALGWNVFSFLYSLYINHFPTAASLYGGFAAVCLIMLWLYFCMIILLCGAEINKIYYTRRNAGNGASGKPVTDA